MDESLAYALVAVGVLIPIVGGAGVAYWITKVKHYLNVFWEGNGFSRHRLKAIADHVVIAHPVNGQKIWMPLDGSMTRTTRKGSMNFHADGTMGIPVQYTNRPPGWLEMNGKRLGAIAKDMREQKIADASRAGKFDKLFEKLPLLLGIIGALVMVVLIVVVVMYSKVK